MSGRASKQKGSRREREMVERLSCIPGITPKRVPLSGACEGYKGDLSFFINALGVSHTAEVKARATGSGWKTIEGWLGPNDTLFLIEDRHEPLVVLPWTIYRDIMTRLDGVRGNVGIFEALMDELGKDESA